MSSKYCHNTIPESILITDGDRRKIKRLVVIDLHIHSDGTLVEIANSVDDLQYNTSKTGKYKDQPHKPVK
jgi:hypothetical protein